MNAPLPPIELADDVSFGTDVLRSLPQRLAELGSRRVLLICGERSFEASGAAAVLPELQARFEVHRWSDFRANTDHDDLVVGRQRVAESDPDTIVGIGGGSTLDMAKLLAALPLGTDLAALIRSGKSDTTRDRLLVLAPTTSGSGAEATHFAVVYVGEQKYSVAGAALRPDATLIDPSLTLSASAYQRATSGIDAVAQAIESLWANGATDLSRTYARQALPLLLDNIRGFVQHPTERGAEFMALGSHLAGRAIDISKTTAAHALSYGITKTCGLSHGHAVAVTLGPLIEAHGTMSEANLQPQLAAEVHARAMAEACSALDASSPRAAAENFVQLCTDIGLDVSLAAAGVETAPQRRRIAEGVNVQRLGNNPMQLGIEQLEGLLLAAG